MNCENLYVACLKMLNDKYSINEYSKETFISVFNNIYKENNTTTPTNEINKLVLIKIKNDIEHLHQKPIEPPQPPANLENKLKEFENIRTSMNVISSSIGLQDPITDEINVNNHNNHNNPINTIQINNQEPTLINKYKSFIINTHKNYLKINPTIDIKNNVIYPCCLCIPAEIKNKSPYIILSINDNIKNVNYTYIPTICNSTWDIWKPITDNYTDIHLTNNNWTISIIDNFNNLLDLSYFSLVIIDVLENSNNSFSLNIENPHYFNIGDKVKIIKENGSFIDTTVVINNNSRIIIQKNNQLSIDNFINAKIYNYKHQLSLLFKYYAK